MSDSEESKPQAIETSQTRSLLRFVWTWSVRIAVSVLTCLAIGVIAGSYASRTTPLMLLVQPQESGLKYAVERNDSHVMWDDTDQFECRHMDNYLAASIFSNRVRVSCGRIDGFAEDTSKSTHIRIGDQGLNISRTYKGEFMMFSLTIHAALLASLFLLFPGVLLVRSVRRHLRCRNMKRLKRLNRCTNCTYDLAGNESGVCPECGART